jgi:MtN3 and saliva related transmembrane protein
MSPETTQILGAAATVYGLGGALSVLLQARRMHLRGTSGDVSARFFAVYVGGFAIWLLYGLGIGDVPIILVHAVGLLCGSVTLAVALRLRGPAVTAKTPSADGDRARTRPGQLSARERDYRARPVEVRLRGRRDDRAPAAMEAEEVCV